MSDTAIPVALQQRLTAAELQQDLDLLEAARNKREIAFELYQLGLRVPSAELFTEVAGLFSQAAESAAAAGAYFYAADLFHAIGDAANETTCYERAASAFEAAGDWSNAARALRFAALGCEQQKKPVQAAEYYSRAAILVRKAPAAPARAAVDDLSRALVSFASAGLAGKAETVYEALLKELAGLPFEPSETPAVQKIVGTLRNNGMQRLAGKVYVEGMNRRVKASPWNLSKIAGVFWGWTSCYGESWGRWLTVTLGFILIFAVIYLPSPIGVLEFDMKHPYQPPPNSLFWPNWVSAFCFSVTVFSTLGLGDVVPSNSPARLLVSSEALLGYAFLGVFVTLVARKVTR